MTHVMMPQPRPRPGWLKSVKAALIATVIVGIILLAFAWPTATSKVEHLPVAVVGSQEQIDSVTADMPEELLELHPVASRKDAINGILSREVYGGIILGENPEILTASAASPVTSQMLTSVGSSIQHGIDQQVIDNMTEALGQMQSAMRQGPAAAAGDRQGSAPQQARTPPTVTITDVAPLSEDDPRGSGLAIAGLPLTIGGLVGGILISILVTGPRKHLLAIALYGLFGGLLLTAILQGLFGILQSNFWANAAATGLGIAATASVMVGLSALLGQLGIPVGAVLTMLIGNPLSSLTQPKEFLLQPFGEIGQWMVPGLSGTVLRDLSYFPDANITAQMWALIGWLVLGVLLILTGHHRNQSALTGEDEVDEEAQTGARGEQISTSVTHSD